MALGKLELRFLDGTTVKNKKIKKKKKYAQVLWPHFLNAAVAPPLKM